jgi:hypothetical protein
VTIALMAVLSETLTGTPHGLCEEKKGEGQQAEIQASACCRSQSIADARTQASEGIRTFNC